MQREQHFVVPLGLAAFIRSMGVPAENVTELDWWGRALLSLPPLSSPSASAAPATTSAPSSSGDKEEEAAKRQLRITCTPAQHFSGRGAFDRDATLWAGFAFEAVPSNGDKGANVWFAGDVSRNARREWLRLTREGRADTEPSLAKSAARKRKSCLTAL